jgi:hypothetical protein
MGFVFAHQIDSYTRREKEEAKQISVKKRSQYAATSLSDY